jgi:hypothetical protein
LDDNGVLSGRPRTFDQPGQQHLVPAVHALCGSAGRPHALSGNQLPLEGPVASQPSPQALVLGCAPSAASRPRPLHHLKPRCKDGRSGKHNTPRRIDNNAISSKPKPSRRVAAKCYMSVDRSFAFHAGNRSPHEAGVWNTHKHACCFGKQRSSNQRRALTLAWGASTDFPHGFVTTEFGSQLVMPCSHTACGFGRWGTIKRVAQQSGTKTRKTRVLEARLVR